jgi:ABC-2 type transport system permease protein
VLPAWLRPLGYAVPVAYWLELVRRALSAPVAQAFPTFSGYSDLQLLGVLVALILVLAIATLAVFNVCDYLARERGLIDRTTNY